MSLRVHGISASAGVAIGPAYVLIGRRGKVAKGLVPETDVQAELDRFRGALDATRVELEEIQVQAVNRVGEECARIIDSHMLLLDDPEVLRETTEKIGNSLFKAAYAYAEVTQRLIRSFEALEDPYFKERSTDILDVRERVLQHLLGLDSPDLANLPGPVIIVAKRLTPSITLRLPRECVLAFATDSGGRAAHAALLARSMEIPAVVGLRNLLERVESGSTLVVDGNEGTVVVDPGPDELAVYQGKADRVRAFFHGLESLREMEARTQDQSVIRLSANIDYPEEVDAVASHGAQGVGLYRTEYLFLHADGSLAEDEEAQYEAYCEVAQRIHPDPVVIRTIDLGGDKLPGSLVAPEENPFLGYRAIRLCLGRPAIFRTQLRALLRATVHGNLHIMFPMISGVDEFRDAREVLRSVEGELRQEGIPYREDTPLGVMIEVPSAALCADILAYEADFFSVGTNDLTQYTLAVDRNNELVDYLFEPYHPGLLRLLRMVVAAARPMKRQVAICGEMAGDPMATCLLLGLGFDELSTTLMVLPEIKKIIRSVTMQECRSIADEALTLSSTREVRSYLASLTAERFPWLEM